MHDGPVSKFIEFFMAPDDRRAAAVRNQGPAPAYATVSGSYFTADETVVAWESSLTGRPVDEVWAGGGPRVVAPWLNDGSAVFALSDALTIHLAHAGPARLRTLVAEWSSEVIRDGDELDPDMARRVVEGVAGLAREAAHTGRPVYCWVAC